MLKSAAAHMNVHTHYFTCFLNLGFPGFFKTLQKGKMNDLKTIWSLNSGKSTRSPFFINSQICLLGRENSFAF